MYKKSKISTIGFLFVAVSILFKETAYAQYSPRASQWYSPSYGRHWQGQQSNYNQNTGRPNYYSANAASRNYYANPASNPAFRNYYSNVAVAAPPEQSSNHTAGFYEASARTEHGRRLGRMLDVYSAGQQGNIGAALDQVAERFQGLLSEAQRNQGQGMPAQNAAPYTKSVRSGGYSYSKKPWVPYEEYMASKQAGASWSPYASFTASKKSWSQWSKNKFSPQSGGYSARSWSPNPAYSKKQWSPFQNSWSPNPGYSKKTWSPYVAQSQPKWGDGYSKQPWMPTNNPQYGQPEMMSNAPAESPGMDVNDFAMDTGLATETESRSKRTRKEKATTVLDLDVADVEHHAETATNAGVDLDDLDLHDGETTYTKSAETIHMDADASIQGPGDISIEKK